MILRTISERLVRLSRQALSVGQAPQPQTKGPEPEPEPEQQGTGSAPSEPEPEPEPQQPPGARSCPAELSTRRGTCSRACKGRAEYCGTHARMERIGHLPCECAICYETVTGRRRVRLKGCGHTFHRSCIRTWLARMPTCPMCRKWASESLPRRGGVADKLGAFMQRVRSPTELFSAFVAICMTMDDLTRELDLDAEDKLFFIEIAHQFSSHRQFIGALRSLGW